jgi:hypothetical protein
MAAISGTWKAQQQARAVQAGAQIWGTGIDPIHGVRTGDGRNVAPSPPNDLVSPELTQQYEYVPDGGYTSEDYALVDMYGYGTETGTADRPSLGQPDTRADTDDFPSWDYGGDELRAVNHGADLNLATKLEPEQDAAQGWLNKAHGDIAYAKPSDPAQYEVATSMRQRFQTREGSQAQYGRASQYLAPVGSRVVGQKLRSWIADNSVRHAEMTPRSQHVSVRGFWNRGAGTGPPEWLVPNEYKQVQPMQRTPPPDPYQGQEVGLVQYATQDEGWYY